MANCVDQDQMVHFRSYVICDLFTHILRRSSNQCLVDSSKLHQNYWCEWKTVDPDQIVYFRSYAICVRALCLGVQMDMLRTWSDQRLVESSETASKTTG